MREDIIAREAEFDAAFKRYDGLGQYVMEAEKNGTSLRQVIASYAALEGLYRRDPCAGVDTLGQGLGWNMRAFAHAMAVRHGILEPPAPAPDPVEAERAAVTEQQILISVRIVTDDEELHRLFRRDLVALIQYRAGFRYRSALSRALLAWTPKSEARRFPLPESIMRLLDAPVEIRE